MKPCLIKIDSKDELIESNLFISSELDDNNIKVYNTSMDSNLTVFEKKRIELFI
jgi:hypothetical protein